MSEEASIHGVTIMGRSWFHEAVVKTRVLPSSTSGCDDDKCLSCQR